ncbi:hypothetical protein PCANC_28697 [Puccinia coronata f. sp. avenae]|uniref:Retrotransposon gag domain-containing protein n=1 Tax=Puccinia coronata f. sp. avenae TaxID=200324 RepID=A0A2N5TIX9_9BASI|nr:hypothetical protein PCANC_28697 [Puccinia coronata f. sp. avenae]
MARLEEALLLMSMKQEEPPKPPRPTTPPSGRIDLQRFRMTDRPLSTDQALLEVAKGRTDLLCGERCYPRRGLDPCGREPDSGNQHHHLVREWLRLGWLDFRAKLIKFVLPPSWHTTLRHRLHDLSMGDSESFASFSTRARTLQSILNFEQHTTTNFAIAEAIMFGLPQEVKALVNNFRLLRADPFDYSEFESDVQCQLATMSEPT